MSEKEYPDCYLHVREEHSGQEWIYPIRGNARLDLKACIQRWLKREFSGELRLSGAITPRLGGEYYARIMTDNRPPESVVCWTSGGFYTEVTYS
jgi:hypothetical protein